MWRARPFEVFPPRHNAAAAGEVSLTLTLTLALTPPRHNAAAAGDVSLLATRLLALGRADHPDIRARDYDGSTVSSSSSSSR